MVAELAGNVRDALSRLNPDDLKALYERVNRAYDPMKPYFARSDYKAPDSLLDRVPEFAQEMTGLWNPMAQAVQMAGEQGDAGQKQIGGPIAGAENVGLDRRKNFFR